LKPSENEKNTDFIEQFNPNKWEGGTITIIVHSPDYPIKIETSLNNENAINDPNLQIVKAVKELLGCEKVVDSNYQPYDTSKW